MKLQNMKSVCGCWFGD